MKITAIVVNQSDLNKVMNEYNKKLYDYKVVREKIEEDEVYALKLEEQPIEPEMPEIPKTEIKVHFKDSEVNRYELEGDEIFIYLSNSAEEYRYITKYDDKIIEQLDRIIEEN